MSAFITQSDYNASIRTEILDAITRADPSMVEMTEDRAVEEMAGYINSRYDTTAIFSEVGTNRSPVLVMLAIDITLYHLHAVYNPMRFPELRKDRYEQAIKYLSGVQKGNINPVGWPLLANDEGSTGDAKQHYFTSNKKRTNHY